MKPVSVEKKGSKMKVRPKMSALERPRRKRGLEGRETSKGWPEPSGRTRGIREGRLLSWGSRNMKRAWSSLSRWVVREGRGVQQTDVGASSRRFQWLGDGCPSRPGVPCALLAHALVSEPISRLSSTLLEQDLESVSRACSVNLRNVPQLVLS